MSLRHLGCTASPVALHYERSSKTRVGATPHLLVLHYFTEAPGKFYFNTYFRRSAPLAPHDWNPSKIKDRFKKVLVNLQDGTLLGAKSFKSLNCGRHRCVSTEVRQSFAKTLCLRLPVSVSHLYQGKGLPKLVLFFFSVSNRASSTFVQGLHQICLLSLHNTAKRSRFSFCLCVCLFVFFKKGP